jgi:thermopsin
MISNASVSTAFMTSTQLQNFDTNNGRVSDSMVYQNGTTSSQILRVGPGSYAVLVYAYGGNANVTLTLTVFPNNPFVAGPLTVPEPSGIASFGLTNQSGVDSPYAVASTDVLGFASISSMDAYNSTAESVGANPSGATLQLNTVLVVNEAGGESQIYWCQNTPDFVTSANQVAMADNVWNFSSSGFLSNDSVTSEGGGGSVYTSQQSGSTQYYYSFEGSNATYSLPLGMVLLVNATAEPGIGVYVEFGAQTTGPQTGGEWFDNVTIHDPEVQSAYFLTSGNDTTPNGYFYDTELIFGGEGNGEATSFTHMDSSLGLFYANGTSSTVTPFPSYFSFGQDTYESADNLKVTYSGGGEARVAVGTPNYDYLGFAAGTTSITSVEEALGFPGMSIGATTSSSSTGSQGIPQFPYQLWGVTVLTFLVVGVYMAERRHRSVRSTGARICVSRVPLRSRVL